MNEYIFREYDIRGIVEDDFSKDVVIHLGLAFGTYIINKGKKNVSISGDIRLTTPQLIKWFTAGLIKTGINIINIGILPTPVNYFSMFHLEVDGAVQITGSHNPSEYNGFKLSFNKKPFYGKQIQELKEIILSKDFIFNKLGKETEYNIINDYIKMIKNKIILKKPLKIAMDCGNAAGCLIAPQVFDELNIDITKLYCEPDGTFPNHHPDPTVDENLIDLIKIVKQGDYDFGVAYDGDADRVVVIDELGNIIRSDNLMAIFLPDIIN